jgi:hypothetical protein
VKIPALSLVCLLSAGGFAFAQQAPATILPPADPARVFITDSASWETRGSAGGGGNGHGGGFFASSSGGARPQTAEIIKTFGQRCPQVKVNNLPNMVDYVVELDHEGGKGILRHKDKVAVFIRTSGDGIFSESTLSVGGSVEDACKAILANWAAHAPELKAAALVAAAPPPAPAPIPIVVQAPAAAATPGVSVDASVPNCDIEVDGEFVGNTPSAVTLAAGKHQVVVKKAGYQDWSRSMTFSGGTVRLNAEMVAKP